MKSNINETHLIDSIYIKYGYGIRIWQNLIFAFLIYLIEGISVTSFPYMIIPLQ